MHVVRGGAGAEKEGLDENLDFDIVAVKKCSIESRVSNMSSKSSSMYAHKVCRLYPGRPWVSKS